MAVLVTDDHDAIRGQLDRFLAHDPVRATSFGSVRAALEDGAWAAWPPPDAGGSPPGSIAVRSGVEYAVMVAGPWPGPLRHELAVLLGRLPRLAGLAGDPALISALVAALPREPADTTAQGLYRLDELTDPVGVPGAGGVADDLDLVTRWLAEFATDLRHPLPVRSAAATRRDLARGTWWLWRDDTGRPVSMARRQPTIAGSARIGPVYTPPADRGHGYGSAVTATATRDVLADAAIPVLFTELDNPTSNAIYRRLGYRLVEQRSYVRFS